MKKLILSALAVLLLSGTALAACDLPGKMQEFANRVQQLAMNDPGRMEKAEPELEAFAKDMEKMGNEMGKGVADAGRMDAMCRRVDAMLDRLGK